MLKKVLELSRIESEQHEPPQDSQGIQEEVPPPKAVEEEKKVEEHVNQVQKDPKQAAPKQKAGADYSLPPVKTKREGGAFDFKLL